LQKLNQLIGVELPTSGFLKFLVLNLNFQGGNWPVCLPAEAHGFHIFISVTSKHATYWY